TRLRSMSLVRRCDQVRDNPARSTRQPPIVHAATLFSNPTALFGSLLFGAIGLAAFIYGKRMVLYKSMVIGIVLMAYPYFVAQTWLLYAVGCALCVGLYVFRE